MCLNNFDKVLSNNDIENPISTKDLYLVQKQTYFIFKGLNSQLSGSFGYDPGVLSLSIRRLQTFPRPNLAVNIILWMLCFLILQKYCAAFNTGSVDPVSASNTQFTEQILP